MAPPRRPIHTKGAPLTAKDITRFWSYVVKRDDGCWIWSGAKGSGYDTYGRFNVGGVVYRAHRLAFRLVIGREPDQPELRHTCDTPSCVNPAHLTPSTHAENMADMKAKKRGGSRNRAVTHCRRGHAYAGDNLYTLNGKRYCKTCKQAHWRKTYGKGKSET